MKKWSVGGNLASNAVVRTLEDGRDMLSFTVASNSGRKKADFINCVVSGKQGFANNILPYLVTGKPVVCHGKAAFGKPSEKDNNVYQNVFCSIRSLFQLELIGGSNVVPGDKADNIAPQGAKENAAFAEAAQESAAAGSVPDYDSFDDDIPF